MAQRTVISEVDCTNVSKLKAKITLATEDVLPVMLKYGYATMSDGLKDAYCQYILSTNSTILLISTLDEIFITNHEQSNQTS